jgi:hemerythrin-like domain-containing protein
MCEYCGCRQIEPLAELMDEHLALLDEAGEIQRALSHRDWDDTLPRLRRLATLLDRHVEREEDGVFAALRETGEYVDEVAALEQEHRDFHAEIERLDPSEPDFVDQVTALFTHLAEHIDREDLGIFPVSVVTLHASGWDVVARVHSEQPSFLVER